MTTYTINISDERITVSPAIDGVEITADLRDSEWYINDGYNTFRRQSEDEAVTAVQETIGFYSEEDYEVIIAR